MTPTLNTPDQIKAFSLLALAQRVRMESVGMRSRGRSARSIAKAELGLPGRPADQVLIDGLRAKAFALSGAAQPEGGRP